MTKYEIKNTTQFKKDYKLAKRRGLDINLLKGIITKLANGEVLAPKHKDHPLSGDWVGHRECHIFLFIAMTMMSLCLHCHAPVLIVIYSAYNFLPPFFTI
jgi:addiction module RelE/StbE family toxin